MTYHTYNTHAIILQCIPTDENDVVYILFTQDLGLIVARASGVRYAKSKLRPVLQAGNYVVCTFVKGKTVWRITGAEELYVPNVLIKKILARLTIFIRKTIVFDVPDSKIFKTLLSACTYHSHVIDIYSYRTIEHVTLVRIMHHLSLWPHTHEQELLLVAPYTESNIQKLQPLMREYRNTLQEVLRTAFI